MENVSTACWTLKSDLIVSRQDNREGVFYVVKDPSTEQFFRFKEIENYIAQQCDGQTSKEDLRLRVEKTFNVSLTQENIDQFINRLCRIGLLVGTTSAPAVLKKSRWRFRGDIFYLRCPLFDPDRLFDWLLPKIQFAFTPAYIGLCAGLIVLAASITITSWSAIIHEFSGLFKLEFLFQAWLIAMGVVTLHEFAHGLTCKHFGGRVREIGFLLIYFQPALYCNVSDAWLFPNKSHRMWVTFAGAFFEISLWAVATIVWRMTDPGTTVNYLALVVTVTSAFKIFFNMNPLIKLDGYYLLCDLVDIPNLRQKAAGYLNSRVKRLFGLVPGTPDVDTRLRNFFILYSILSGAYIYWILGNIALWFGDYMTRNYQAWGFIIFVTTLAVLFRNQLGGFVSPVTSGIKSIFIMAKIPKPVKWLIVLAALTTAVFLIRMPLKISGSFVVMPQHNADVRAEAEGIIQAIYVDEGDEVKAGTLIARLSDRDYNAELRKKQADIDAKEAELRLLESGAKPEEIEMVRNQITKTKELSMLANDQMDRDRKLVDQKVISVSEFENSKERATIRERDLQEAQGKLKLLQAGNRQEELEALRANIRSLEAHKRFIQEQLVSLEIHSPIDGVVTTHKLKEKIGENVKKGDLVTEVYAMKMVIAEIAVPEKEIGEVRLGQKVVLKARAYPGEIFEGEVISIAPVATRSAEEWITDRMVLVTTQLDNSKGLLKPEMTGHGKIVCEEYRLIDLISRRIVRYFRVEFWSWW
jgi:putative peptide zinc metalloprotease protein